MRLSPVVCVREFKRKKQKKLLKQQGGCAMNVWRLGDCVTVCVFAYVCVWGCVEERDGQRSLGV